MAERLSKDAATSHLR